MFYQWFGYNIVITFIIYNQLLLILYWEWRIFLYRDRFFCFEVSNNLFITHAMFIYYFSIINIISYIILGISFLFKVNFMIYKVDSLLSTTFIRMMIRLSIFETLSDQESNIWIVYDSQDMLSLSYCSSNIYVLIYRLYWLNHNLFFFIKNGSCCQGRELLGSNWRSSQQYFSL